MWSDVAIGLCGCVADDVDIGGGQGWPLEAMLNNLTATALGGKLSLFLYLPSPTWILFLFSLIHYPIPSMYVPKSNISSACYIIKISSACSA